MADKLLHGTHNRGERHNMVKLSEEEAAQIIALKGVKTQREIAAEFGVSRHHVAKIHTGRKWSFLRGLLPFPSEASLTPP